MYLYTTARSVSIGDSSMEFVEQTSADYAMVIWYLEGARDSVAEALKKGSKSSVIESNNYSITANDRVLNGFDRDSIASILMDIDSLLENLRG